MTGGGGGCGQGLRRRWVNCGVGGGGSAGDCGCSCCAIGASMDPLWQRTGWASSVPYINVVVGKSLAFGSRCVALQNAL